VLSVEINTGVVSISEPVTANESNAVLKVRVRSPSTSWFSNNWLWSLANIASLKVIEPHRCITKVIISKTITGKPVKNTWHTPFAISISTLSIVYLSCTCNITQCLTWRFTPVIALAIVAVSYGCFGQVDFIEAHRWWNKQGFADDQLFPGSIGSHRDLIVSLAFAQALHLHSEYVAASAVKRDVLDWTKSNSIQGRYRRRSDWRPS
jgi:hypothetical protein